MTEISPSTPKKKFNEQYCLGLFAREIKIRTNTSNLLRVSSSRISRYLKNKSKPPVKVAKDTSLKLNIEAQTVLGV